MSEWPITIAHGVQAGGLSAPPSPSEEYSRAIAREWVPIATAPENREVETAIIDGDGERNVQTLRRFGQLWFMPDCAMCVYYTPTHWREVQP